MNPNGQATTVHWEFGLDAAYRPPGFSGNVFDHSTAPQSLGGGSSPQPVQASVSNLVPNAVYHVRLVASNGAGTSTGPDQTFTTPKGPPPPAPVVGHSENATPGTGKVFVLANGQLVPLTETSRLPSGAVLDTLHGSVNLIAATGQKGKSYTGTFTGAVFQLTQTAGGPSKGLSTLHLLEGAFPGAPTYASCTAKSARASSPKPTLRSARGSCKPCAHARRADSAPAAATPPPLSAAPAGPPPTAATAPKSPSNSTPSSSKTSSNTSPNSSPKATPTSPKPPGSGRPKALG